MSIVDAQANTFLDQLLGTAGVLPNPCYIGLLLAAPNFDGSGVVEPPGASNYLRVAIANNSTVWPAAINRTKKHTTDIVFNAASAAWGTIWGAGVFKTTLGNDLTIFAQLTAPRVVNQFDVFRFLAASAPFKVVIPAT